MESNLQPTTPTANRCQFKSKGEEQIARFLSRYRIGYQYEHPVSVYDRGQLRIWYPDFRLPDYEIIIEYFGVNGDPDYDRGTQRRREVYRQNGIDGLYLTRASFQGDWPGRILNQIEATLRDRIDSFYHQTGLLKKCPLPSVIR
jgi:hypothetical protein